MILSEHARKEMLQDRIDEAEIKACLEYGKLVIKQLVKEEMRYGRQLEPKNKRIIAIYTHEKSERRIITAYAVRRKRWQERE